MDVKEIGFIEISIPANRHRKHKPALVDQLVESIKVRGLLNPITVCVEEDGPCRYKLISGAHRHAAIRRLDWPTIPCNVLDGLSALDAEEAELRENFDRGDLTTAERDLHTARMMEIDKERHKLKPANQYTVSSKSASPQFEGRQNSKTSNTAKVVAQKTGKSASAPRGSFILRQGDTPVVLLSAGIGVTPVLAMLHKLAAESSTREIWWLYGTRNGREHPFAEETRGLLSALPRGHSHICYSSPDPEDRPNVDFDAPGRLNMRVLEELNLPRNGDFYICGPSTFMRDLTAGLAALGVAPDRIRTEIFSAGPSITPGVTSSPHRPPHLPAGPPGSGPMVSFARSGLNVRWVPSFQSLLELAEACDAPVRWSCRTGVCHTCETVLIAGTIGYRPDPVEAPADGNVLICCAQPEDDVVIDL
jgi:ParB/RepB/Spo0J family partition protein